MPPVPPSTGFQAIVLCGPGVSLNTFTSSGNIPKCLLPVANRPMIFYMLDWLRRSGIHDVTLITPPSALASIRAALQQNPYLTALPTPTVIAAGNSEMGTAELLRQPEVQSQIKTDFLLLPCDLVCEIPGESLLEAWMVSRSTIREVRNARGSSTTNGDAGGRGATAPLEQDEAPAVSHQVDGPLALRYGLSKLVMSAPMSTIREQIEADKGSFLVRHSLMEANARVKLLTTFRDAHLYVFPYWVKDLLAKEERFDSISEDLVGYWAKAGWQKGLGEKLGIDKILHQESSKLDSSKLDESASLDGESLEDEIDLQDMSTTKAGPGTNSQSTEVPPILAYVQKSAAPYVRRVDSSAVLLSTSLRLAKLESIEDVGRQHSPFAHNQKVANPDGVAQRCTVTASDCLLDQNVTVEQFAVIKETVIGANAHISSGARLTRCVVMDGAVIGPRSTLTGCIIGRNARVGRECQLAHCEVQDGLLVEDETEAKNEKFMAFEGLDQDGEGENWKDGGSEDNEDDNF
ncbi:eukaryotic translation initiation factor subunit eIF2B-gamma [Penicillium chermesinum]|uniref:Translation initiation factor eIF2B subunit gamma n=1 Tax=Penicillium chermesinum TaxID=63820 RepID=A0A9W9NUP8_9EURO|nr:eukaryotic translation initiation factor subunit eIF2B-gamma [Penicillium chermesinum]KAJ5226469.1 eukaryotic translation initiation factor subunit eIF2B-gamma [Penicillium chermesinum]